MDHRRPVLPGGVRRREAGRAPLTSWVVRSCAPSRRLGAP